MGVLYLMHELLPQGITHGSECLTAVVRLYVDLFASTLQLAKNKNFVSCVDGDAVLICVLAAAVYRKFIYALPTSVPFGIIAEGLKDATDEVKLYSLSLTADLLVAMQPSATKKDIGKAVVEAILGMLKKEQVVRRVRASAPLKEQLALTLSALNDADRRVHNALRGKIEKLNDGVELWKSITRTP